MPARWTESLRLFALSFGLLLLCWGPFVGRGPFQGTEARRAAIARAMAQAGDFAVPRLAGEATLVKPPLHYQLQALAFRWFGVTKSAARLPSLVLLAAACAAAGLCVGLWSGDRARGWLLVSVLAFHPIVFRFAVSAEIDGSFAAWTAFGLLAAAALGRPGGRSAPLAAVFGLCIGAAFLTKGPQVLVLAAPAAFAVRRRLGGPGFLLAGACFLAPVALWLTALARAGVSPGDLWTVLTRESVGRAEGFGFDDLLSVPAYLAKVLALYAPALILWFRVRGLAASRPAAALAAAALAGVLLLLPFPHRPTRYFFPALLPGLVACALSGGEPGRRFRAIAAPAGRFLPPLFAAAAVAAGFVAPPWLQVLPLGLCAAGAAFLVPRASVWVPALLWAGFLVTAFDLPRRQALAPKSAAAAALRIEELTRGERVLAWGHVPPEILWRLDDRAVEREAFDLPESRDFGWIVHEDPKPAGWRPPPVPAEPFVVQSLEGKDVVLARVRR